MILRRADDNEIDMGKTKQAKQLEWQNINNTVKSVFKEKSESDKSNSPLMIKIPKFRDSTDTYA